MMNQILTEIAAERQRQDDKWGEQNHPMLNAMMPHARADERSRIADTCRQSCDDNFQDGGGDWYAILMEEVAEAFEQAALGNLENFRTEMIQVLAVATAMVECVDRNQKL